MSVPLPSVLEVLKIGIGPSSSHTLGPLRAALDFGREVAARPPDGRRLRVRLLGSLALTGRGHLTDAAVTAGLAGFDPEREANETIVEVWKRVAATGEIRLGEAAVAFAPAADIVLDPSELPAGAHPNTLVFELLDGAGAVAHARTYVSLGGGRVAAGPPPATAERGGTGMDALLDACLADSIGLADLALRTEAREHGRGEAEVFARLDALWRAMEAAVSRGLHADGVLPGQLRLERRASELFENFQKGIRRWGLLSRDVTLTAIYAIAVAEENAAGGRVVTAPTCGSAGIVPAVLHVIRDRFRLPERRLHEALLVSGLVGAVVVENASIAGAEVGCQGEVGVASAMAAAAAVHLLEGTPMQAEAAAETALEHHLGLTCDPVCGLVQVPCIERNAVGAVTALNAANLALLETGRHLVSFDTVVATMREVGRDMHRKYKETALGGLAAARTPRRP